MTKASQIVYTGALALITITSSVLLLPEPLGSGSPLAWLRVPFPILFGISAGYQAYQEYRSGEEKSAGALLHWAIYAASIMMVLSF